MSNVTTAARTYLHWVWQRTSAAIAMLLIVIAVVIGYQIGKPAPERMQAGHDEHSEHAVDAGEAQMYTCSMHPSVRLPDADSKCPICFMALIPVADNGGEGNVRRITLHENAVAMSRIETAKVGRFFPTVTVRLYGKLAYDETSVARISAYFPGRIERLFVNYLGVPVGKGDHLAEMYSPELLASFEELRQVSAAAANSQSGSDLVRQSTRDTLTAAREKLRLIGLTKQQITAIEDGSFQGDLLTIFSPIGGVVTHLAVREGDYLQTGGSIATVADLSRLWLDMEAYESQLPMLRWGQPVTFTVEAHPGETFEGRISFIEPMIDDRTRTAAVRVAVDNPGVRLKPGMFASADVRTRLAATGAVLSDELAGHWVSPMHPTIVKNGPGQCDICGMDMVTAESLGIVGDPSLLEEPLVIPKSAVLFTGTRSVVYVEVHDAEKPTYEGREVVLGPRADDLYIVREGLREGEMIVVNGAFRIDSAMQIAAKPSMMTPEGGRSGSVHAGHGAMSGATMSNMQVGAHVPEVFINSLEPVYEAYFDAQEALAGDDLADFVQATAAIKTGLGLVREVGLVGEPLGEWRRAAVTLRLGQTVTTIDDARIHFERMSDGIFALQRAFGHSGEETWHLAYCPMAFDFKGADWLQRGTEINNPYFGASMLRCGEVQESYAPVSAEGDHE